MHIMHKPYRFAIERQGIAIQHCPATIVADGAIGRLSFGIEWLGRSRELPAAFAQDDFFGRDIDADHGFA